MTFEEAFNSGCRFKLPENHLGKGGWAEDFWWIKSGEGVLVIHQYRYYNLIDLEDEDIEENRYLYQDQIDWFLHPADEHNMKFNNKLEDLTK